MAIDRSPDLITARASGEQTRLSRFRGSAAFRWSVLCLLTLLAIYNFMDRLLPFVLIESIKKDIPLTDTMIGLLGGLAFTLVYSLAGLPIARLADRGRRTRLLAIACGLWALTTAGAGLATSFWTLAASRLGTALGEATVHPTATSLIADLFPPTRRAFALSIYLVGGSLGVMCGLGVGGWLNVVIGWRWTFFAFAAPGLIFVLLFSLLPEPARERGPAHADDGASLVSVVFGLIRQPSFVHLAIGMCLYAAVITSVSTFSPANAIRRFGLTSAEVGLYGLGAGAMGIAGVLCGGALADRLGRGLRRPLLMAAAGSVLSAPLCIACWNSSNVLAYFAFLAPASLIHSCVLPVAFSVAQTLGGHSHRAVAVAVLTFSMYAVGGSLGSVVTGAISDAFTARYGVVGLSYALSIVTLGLVWAGAHFYLGARRATD